VIQHIRKSGLNPHGRSLFNFKTFENTKIHGLSIWSYDDASARVAKASIGRDYKGGGIKPSVNGPLVTGKIAVPNSIR